MANYVWHVTVDSVRNYCGSIEAVHACYDAIRHSKTAGLVILYRDGVKVTEWHEGRVTYQNPEFFTPETILANWYAVKTGQITFQAI